MTQNRWWTLAALGALAVVGMYAAVRSMAGVDACGNPGGCAASCCVVPACCPPASKPTQAAAPKQHFHFVLDNLSFRMGGEGECKIKRLEIEYKGDGIEADVAKAALGAGSAGGEDAPPARVEGELNEVIQLLEKLVEAQTGHRVVKPGKRVPPPCGLTLPSPQYLQHPPQYTPPAPAEQDKPKPEQPAGATEEADDGCE